MMKRFADLDNSLPSGDQEKMLTLSALRNHQEAAAPNNQYVMDVRPKSKKRADRCRLKRGEDSACQDLAGTLSNSESAQRMPAYKSHIKHHDTLALWQQSHVSIPNRNKLVSAVYEVVSKRYSAGAGKTPNPREKGEEILAAI